MKYLNPQTGEVWDSDTGQISTEDMPVQKTRWQDLQERSAQLPQYSPTSGMSGVDKFMAGAGKSVVDTGRGLGQLAGMVSPQQVDESRRLDAPLMDTGAGIAGNITGHVAQTMLPGMALKGAGLVPGLSKLGLLGDMALAPKTAIGAGLLGGGYTGIQPVGTGESRAANAGIGAAFGGIGQKVGQYVARGIGKASPYMRQVAEKARQHGAIVPAGAATQSGPLRQLEASFQSNPLTSGKMLSMLNQNQEAVNRAAIRAIGENGNELTADILGNAAKNIGQKIKDSVKGQTINMDQSLLNRLAAIEARYIKLPTIRGDATYQKARDYMLDTLAKGNISGKEYQLVRSELGKVSNKAWNSPDSANPTLGEAIDKMIDMLDDSVAKQLPKTNRKMLSEARRQWANFKAVEASRNGANVSGPKLSNYLVRKQKSAYLRGGGSKDKATQDMYDMARFSDLYKGIVGDSGTATRASVPMMAGQMGGASGLGYLMSGDIGTAAAMGLAAPAIMKGAQMGVMNQPMQRMLSSGGLLGMGASPALARGIEAGATLLPIGYAAGP